MLWYLPPYTTVYLSDFQRISVLPLCHILENNGMYVYMNIEVYHSVAV
jgi:hypothetical protein